MAEKHGSLSINSENIFPIIKKWLYSDHDIFFRELISNGCDAITKLKKLDMMGEYTLPEDYKGKIEVIVNPEEKTLKFIDNGIGMTADEVEEYINQIAFSGATDFIEKYKDKTNEDQIIGHFGLGFYSAFMVAHFSLMKMYWSSVMNIAQGKSLRNTAPSCRLKFIFPGRTPQRHRLSRHLRSWIPMWLLRRSSRRKKRTS